MRAIFKNKTKYDDELCENYCTFHQKTNIFYKNVETFLTFILLFVGIFVGILVNISTISLLCSCLLCILVLTFITNSYIESISYYEVNGQSQDQEFTFAFYDNDFSISNKENLCIISYDQLYKIRVTKKYTYLYTNKSYAFVINNSSFTRGNYIDFKYFLKNKCGLKYREIKFSNA